MPIHMPSRKTRPAMTRKVPSIHGMSALSSLRCMWNAWKIWPRRALLAAFFSFLACLAASLSSFSAIMNQDTGVRAAAVLSVPSARMRGVGSASSNRHPDLLEGLDPEQRAAACAPRGPVCVLAGAGTGKTRTITHRIAYLVRSGHVSAGQVLAVTFTSRAAGELRTRLRGLGVEAAQARTFHAAALRQLRYFWPRVVGDRQWDLIEGNKLRLVGQAANRLGLPTEVEVLRDLTSEIEWAKASLIGPDDYPAAVARLKRDTPEPADRIAELYRGYERTKNEAQLLDFDDLLLHTTAALEGHRAVAEEFRDRYRCFVVDEYQDVTPAQQR